MRVKNWPARLDEYIAESRKKVFSYGTWDCGIFAAGCVKAITGIDKLALLNSYDSKISAYKIIASYGSLEQMITALLGEPSAKSFCQRGDICTLKVPVVEGEEGLAIGVCLGVSFATTGVNGLVYSRMDSVVQSWRVQ